MKRMLLITSLSAVLFGCSSASQVKKEFMFGCTSGQNIASLKKGCECLYQHMVTRHGGEEQFAIKMRDLNQLESVMKDMSKFADQCQQ